MFHPFIKHPFPTYLDLWDSLLMERGFSSPSRSPLRLRRALDVPYCVAVTIAVEKPGRQQASMLKWQSLARDNISSRSNIFMHAQSDLFHPQSKAGWLSSSLESPVSSTGSLRLHLAQQGIEGEVGHGNRWVLDGKVMVGVYVAVFCVCVCVYSIYTCLWEVCYSRVWWWLWGNNQDDNLSFNIVTTSFRRGLNQTNV